jgi:hypothetical protein
MSLHNSWKSRADWGRRIVAQYQLSTDRVTWQDIEPDPTVVVYRPHAETVEKLDGLRRGLGFAQLEWDWGQTLMSGTRLYNLQRFCPAGQAHATVYIRSMIDEVGSAYRRTQKEFRGTMGRVRVERHVLRSGQDWARGVGVVFDELIEPPEFLVAGVCEFGASYGFSRGFAIDVDAGYAYCGTTTGHVLRVSLRDMIVDGVLVTGLGALATARMGPGGRYGYFVERYVLPTRVVKVDLWDMSVSATLSFPNADGRVILDAMDIDTDGGYGYIGTWEQPAKIVKFRLGDMVRIGAVTLNASSQAALEAEIGGVCIDVDDNRIYATTQNLSGTPTTAKVVRLSLNPLVRESAVVLATDVVTTSGLADDAVEGVLYFPTIQTQDNQIVAVRKHPFSVSSYTSIPYNSRCVHVDFDRSSGYLYAPSYETDAPVRRFSHPALVYDSALRLEGYGSAYHVEIDHRFPYVYVSTGTGHLLKVGGGA